MVSFSIGHDLELCFVLRVLVLIKPSSCSTGYTFKYAFVWTKYHFDQLNFFRQVRAVDFHVLALNNRCLVFSVLLVRSSVLLYFFGVVVPRFFYPWLFSWFLSVIIMSFSTLWFVPSVFSLSFRNVVRRAMIRTVPAPPLALFWISQSTRSIMPSCKLLFLCLSVLCTVVFVLFWTLLVTMFFEGVVHLRPLCPLYVCSLPLCILIDKVFCKHQSTLFLLTRLAEWYSLCSTMDVLNTFIVVTVRLSRVSHEDQSSIYSRTKTSATVVGFQNASACLITVRLPSAVPPLRFLVSLTSLFHNASSAWAFQSALGTYLHCFRISFASSQQFHRFSFRPSPLEFNWSNIFVITCPQKFV